MDPMQTIQTGIEEIGNSITNFTTELSDVFDNAIASLIPQDVYIQWDNNGNLRVNDKVVYDSTRRLYELEKLSVYEAKFVLDSLEYIPEQSKVSLTCIQLKELIPYFDPDDHSTNDRSDLHLTVFIGTLYSFLGDAIESDEGGNTTHIPLNKLENLLQFIERAPDIHQLHFYCQDINDREMQNFSSHRHENLKYLIFHDCDQLHSDIFNGIDFDVNLPHLKGLRFTHCNQITSNILPYLNNCQTLTTLIFDSSFHFNIADLLDSNITFPHIKLLSLADINVHDSDLEAIARIFPNLKILDISTRTGNSVVTNDGFYHLKNLSLTHLNCSGLTSITNEGIDHLNTDSLKALDARYTKAEVPDEIKNYFSKQSVETKYI